MITNLDSLRAVHQHVANRTREIVEAAAAAFRADVLIEQTRGTGLHRRHGKLFDGTQTSTRWSSRGATISASNAVPYAPYLEFGTRPHEIRPKHPGGTLRFFWSRVGKWVALRKVNHPGNRTYNFLRRAVGIAGERMGYVMSFGFSELARRF